MDFKASTILRESLLEIPWHTGPELTLQQRRRLGRSIQEFPPGGGARFWIELFRRTAGE
jgi:hypothetical protein